VKNRIIDGGLLVRLLIVALMATTAILLVPSNASASEVGIEVLQAGWDGSVVPGCWNPVKLRVTGGAADANVRVEIVLKSRYQPGPQATPMEYSVGAYGEEVALPAAVSKEVTLWVPGEIMGGSSIAAGTVQVSSGGQVLAEQRVDFRSNRTPYWPLVAVLAESPSVARALSSIELPVQGLPVPLSVAKLSATDIPSSAELLNALSGLVIQGDAAVTLTGEQRRVLIDWVAAGGHLVISGGPSAAQTVAALPPDNLPVRLDAMESAADLSPLAAWAGVSDPPLEKGPSTPFHLEGGALLAGSGDNPLAWRLGVGRGTVTLLGVDPALEPLASWSGTPTLLYKALEPALPAPGENEKMRAIQMEGRDIAMQLQGVVDAMPPEAFPDWQIVAALLGIFALAVGPVLHIVLWRADKRGWIWVSVPAAALLISGSLYFLGIGREGRDVLTNVVAYLRLEPEAGQAREWLVAGFYAPTHEDLSVSVQGDVPVKVVSRGSGPFGLGWISGQENTEPPFRVVKGRNARVEFESDQWGMRSVAMSRDLGQTAGGITAKLRLEEGIVKGTVTNDTPYMLEDAAVVAGQSLVKLGDLAPGQTAQVAVDPIPATDPYRGGPSLAYRLLGQPMKDSSYGVGVTYRAAPVVAVPAPMPAAQPRNAPAREATPTATATPTPAQAGSPSPTVTEPTPTPTNTPGSAATATPTPAPMPAVPPYMPEQYELPPDPEIQRRVRLMDSAISAMNTNPFGPGGQSMPLTFLAFTRSQVDDQLPSAGNHPTFFLAVIEQPLKIDFPAGPFSIPSGLILPTIVEQNTRGIGGGSDGAMSWIELYGGSIVYGFTPPLTAKAKVETIVVSTRQIGSATPIDTGVRTPPGPDLVPGAAGEGVFSIYNWQTATWDKLPGGQEEARISPASPYIGANGQIKIQVGTAMDQLIRIIQPEMVIEGTVEE
jgi:hypothetical protein